MFRPGCLTHTPVTRSISPRLRKLPDSPSLTSLHPISWPRGEEVFADLCYKNVPKPRVAVVRADMDAGGGKSRTWRALATRQTGSASWVVIAGWCSWMTARWCSACVGHRARLRGLERHAGVHPGVRGGLLIGMISPGRTFIEPAWPLLVAMPTRIFLWYRRRARAAGSDVIMALSG